MTVTTPARPTFSGLVLRISISRSTAGSAGIFSRTLYSLYTSIFRLPLSFTTGPSYFE